MFLCTAFVFACSWLIFFLSVPGPSEDGGEDVTLEAANGSVSHDDATSAHVDDVITKYASEAVPADAAKCMECIVRHGLFFLRFLSRVNEYPARLSLGCNVFF
jgi:hypothetical protein